MLWNLTVMALLGAGNYLGPGYFGIPITVYSSDPLVRLEEMMIDKESLHDIQTELQRFYSGQPSNLTPYRVHGGVGPAASSP